MKTWNLSDQKSLQLAQKAGWSVAGLARERGVCVRTLEREFQASHKTSVTAWMSRLRWRLAKKSLIEGVAAKVVAGKIGYSHAGNFSREFKNRFGSSPCDFAKHQRLQPAYLQNVAK